MASHQSEEHIPVEVASQDEPEVPEGSKPPPLVGTIGSQFVRTSLANKAKKPQEWLAVIRERGALRNPACAPLMKMLELQGVAPSQAHKAILEQATKVLLKKISSVHPEALRPLLDDVFPFISVPQLRPITVAVLSHLQPIPKGNLHLLAAESGVGDVFWELPISVQRQVWEVDVKALQKHGLLLLHSWNMEAPVQAAALDMLACLPGAAGQGLLASASLLSVRQKSRVISRLVEMVGGSRQVYKAIVELLAAKWATAKHSHPSQADLLLCSLRRHLLMALHGKHSDHLYRWESIHKLTWALDACARERCVPEARFAELETFFSLLRMPSPCKPPKKRRKGVTDEESAQRGLQGQDGVRKALCAAAMVVREQALMHLLAYEVVRRLYATATAATKPPRADEKLLFFLRLLQLGSDAFEIARDARRAEEGMRDPPEAVLSSVLPCLTGLIVDASIARVHNKGAAVPESMAAEQRERFCGALAASHVARLVAQAFLLERLAKRDPVNCLVLLSCLARVHRDAPAATQPEWSPFLASLARRMCALAGVAGVATGGAPRGAKAPAGRGLNIQIGDALWKVAVDDLLLHGADGGPLLHCEVLTLVDAFVRKRLVLEQNEAVAAAARVSRAATAMPLQSAGGHASKAEQMRLAKASAAARHAASTVAHYMHALLAKTEASRKQSSKHIAKLLRDAGGRGVPADVKPWDEQPGDGVLWKYEQLLQQWPDVEGVASEEVKEYLSLPTKSPPPCDDQLPQ